MAIFSINNNEYYDELDEMYDVCNDMMDVLDEADKQLKMEKDYENMNGEKRYASKLSDDDLKKEFINDRKLAIKGKQFRTQNDRITRNANRMHDGDKTEAYADHGYFRMTSDAAGKELKRRGIDPKEIKEACLYILSRLDEIDEEDLSLSDKVKLAKYNHQYNKQIHDPKNIGKHFVSPELSLKIDKSGPAISMDKLEKNCNKK